MKKYLFLLSVVLAYHVFAGNANGAIKFGTLSLVDARVVKKQLEPFERYLSASLGEEVSVMVGRNYQETMEKLADGRLDIGFIGPAPYVKIRGQVDLIATLVTKDTGAFSSVIVTRKDSDRNTIEDLDEAVFAFGSPRSTLSFYVPAYLLYEEGVLPRLHSYSFLNKHDKVAKNVIIGKYDAGAMKKSVYQKYQKYLKIIKESKPYADFVIVTSKDFDTEKKNRLKKALILLTDKTILSGLKSDAVGFIDGNPADYEPVTKIIEEVDKLFLSR